MHILLKKDFLVNRIIPLILFIIAVYFPVFLHLGADALGMWDESLYALRAFHIAHDHEYLRNFSQFEGGFNHPNTKPPLITLIQALFFQTFGYNELSLRLPVAISVLLMLLFMVYYSGKEFKSPALGYFSALVLITSPGFVNLHVARTGDHDAVLAFWMLLVMIYFYKMVTVSQKQDKYVWLVAIFLACAVLTKSVAGLFPLPALLAFAIYKKKLVRILSSWHTWGAIVLFLVLVASFYLYRELTRPTFLETLWQEEIGGRYVGNNHGHNNPWYYYINLLYETDFIPWLFFLPMSVIILFTKSGKKYREFSLYLLFNSFVLLLIISFSSTKCEWYHASMFPPLAMVAGIGILWLFETIKRFIVIEKYPVKLLGIVSFIGLVFLTPYIRIIKKVSFPEKHWIEEQYGEFMKYMEPGMKYSVAPERYVNFCVMFYVEVANKIDNREIALKNYKSSYHAGEIVMSSKNTSWLNDRYEIKILYNYKNLVLLEITKVK